MIVSIFSSYGAVSKAAAEIVAHQLRRKKASTIGFATGGTPVGLYALLVRRHLEEGLDFAGVTTFNLDEYVGLPDLHEQSYQSFMWRHVFSHVNVRPSRVHFPLPVSGDGAFSCSDYEERIARAGGIDLQILGIGANGHIGFNEPGSSFDSRTRATRLTPQTIADNARFFAHADDVPQTAITMGIGTIMDARAVLMMASGPAKAQAIAAALEGPVTEALPASVLQRHANACVLLDEEAAAGLSTKMLRSSAIAARPDSSH